MSNKTYEVNSSHGTLTINEDGNVIDIFIDHAGVRRSCDDCIDNIEGFDLKEFLNYWAVPIDGAGVPATLPDAFDILDLAGRNKDGTKFTADKRWRNDVRKEQLEDTAVPSRDKRASVQASISLPDVKTLEHICDYMTEQGECANYIKEGCPTDHIQIEVFKLIDLIGRLRGAPKDTWIIHYRAASRAVEAYLHMVEDVPNAIARLREIYPGDDLRILDINATKLRSALHKGKTTKL